MFFILASKIIPSDLLKDLSFSLFLSNTINAENHIFSRFIKNKHKPVREGMGADNGKFLTNSNKEIIIAFIQYKISKKA